MLRFLANETILQDRRPIRIDRFRLRRSPSSLPSSAKEGNRNRV
jgi:hypothetical protein